jgi:hypothetical protein
VKSINKTEATTIERFGRGEEGGNQRKNLRFADRMGTCKDVLDSHTVMEACGMHARGRKGRAGWVKLRRVE